MSSSRCSKNHMDRCTKEGDRRLLPRLRPMATIFNSYCFGELRVDSLCMNHPCDLTNENHPHARRVLEGIKPPPTRRSPEPPPSHPACCHRRAPLVGASLPLPSLSTKEAAREIQPGDGFKPWSKSRARDKPHGLYRFRSHGPLKIVRFMVFVNDEHDERDGTRVLEQPTERWAETGCVILREEMGRARFSQVGRGEDWTHESWAESDGQKFG
uniref:Uncharacterized protein n=1 Tax=Oryza sativa subsp. japonica TaxID=39947 RepID=Q7XIL0_ORYSJ|nr:hypothetical protein [Oryza sativa Japonica Group]